MFNLSVDQDKLVLLGELGVSPEEELKAGSEPAEQPWLFSQDIEKIVPEGSI